MISEITPCVLVAVPVHNEEGHIGGVLGRVSQYARDVLVVDDGSSDGTPGRLLDAARELPGLRVIRHRRNRGYGRSLRTAFTYARRAGYRWVITMDCDEQHEPESLPGFYRAIAQDDADIVSGTRYPRGFDAGGGDAAPPDRRAINRLITAQVNAQLGLGLTDAFCGFKAHRVSTLGRLGLTEDGYAFPMQLWARAAALGLRVVELPVRRIYADPNRRFGGGLDDPEARLAHYRAVLEREIAAGGAGAPGAIEAPGLGAPMVSA
ncbi:MAG: glycosyltransferase family 2 protein [Planctomyces sp.]|nr:glycosyltransferase family 2 protein [Planctomyces sp.]